MIMIFKSKNPVFAILVAAGRGLRAGGEKPKQFHMVGGRTVAEWSYLALASHPRIEQIIIVAPAEGASPFRDALHSKSTTCVSGGPTRSASVKAGLDAIQNGSGLVLIHDAARPGLSHDVIDRVLYALETHRAAAPALPVVDALWKGSKNGEVEGIQDRAELYRAQTPQGFDVETIKTAHEEFQEDAADDVEVVRAAGTPVAIVQGSENNFKYTVPEDLPRLEKLLGAAMDIRVGNGFDVHKFGPGDHAMLCGIRVDHSQAMVGHSDADVGLHTITDAIYGALADGDIGTHFPPSDPQWKGAESQIFLEHARERVAAGGYVITNVDCTLICEEPKIGPHAEAMRNNVAKLLKIDANQVSVKATTTETLGFTGRKEGIACQATVTLVKP